MKSLVLLLVRRLFLPALFAIATGQVGEAFADPNDWPDSISPRGGHYFAQRVELPVPPFAQDDPKWSEDLLGPTHDTLGDEGCTLTSVVMVLNYYGVKTNPGAFNRYLTAHGGYNAGGYLSFPQVVTYAPDKIRLAYQGQCSHASLDRNILAGRPVIVQVTLSSGGRHFVVVAGKQGLDYLVRDPAAGNIDTFVVLQTVTARIDQEFLYVKR